MSLRKKIVHYRAGCTAIDLFSLNMSHLHQSVQPISNNDANIYKTTCHETRLWLNDKRTRNFRRSSGVTHGSPAVFCIADDDRGLIE